MLIKDLYKIEYNLQQLANILENKFSELKTDIFVDECKNSFYFVNKSNFEDYFKNGTTYYFKQKGYFNYGPFSEYYYNCNRDIIVRSIKNKYYYIYDYDTLIRIIFNSITREDDNRKIYIILDEKLFKYIIRELRIKIKYSMDSNNVFFDLINLYPIHKKLLDKFVFYVAYQKYEIFSLFYKNFTICIGYDIDINIYNTEINTSEYLNKYATFILKQAKKLFNQDLNQTKFLFIETDYIKYNNHTTFLFTFVFKMYDIKQLIQANILDELYKFV